MSDFMWFDEVDPVEKAQKTAKAVEAVRTELEDRGIIAFVMNADSLPEAEQRLAMREVNAAIDDVVDRHMPEDEGAKARLVSSIFKQFEGQIKESAADPSCTSCSGTGTLSDGSHCTCTAPAYNDSGMKNAAKDKMPMKDGRPAFVSEEEAEEAKEEEKSDSDKKNEDKKSDEDEESEEESEDDEEDESEESEESKEESEENEEESKDKKEPKKGSTIIGAALPNCPKCFGSGTVGGAACDCTQGWNTTSSSEEHVSRCPACGDVNDYCQGHGDIGDPVGAAILQKHDDGNHEDCHPNGCDDK